MIAVNLEIPAANPVERKVYDFKRADWPRLKLRLLDMNWRCILAVSGDEATSAMVQCILEAVASAIHSRTITDKVWARP